MFSELKTRKKALSLIEVMAYLFIISVAVITCVLEYDLEGNVVPRKEISTLINDLKIVGSVAMNSGRSINSKFGKKSYSFYDTAATDTTTACFTATRDLKYGEIQTNNDRKENAPSSDNLSAGTSKSIGSARS